jgi:GxxExxY protein
MKENELSRIIVSKCFEIHEQLGPGLLESVYEHILHYELVKAGLVVKRQLGIPVVWYTERLDPGFRADLIVETKVLIEIKSIESIAPVHQKTVLTYLRLANIRLGLLVNFNVALIKDGIQRIVNGLGR